MPEYFYCLKCSKAKYVHGRGCRYQITEVHYYNSRGASCEPNDPDGEMTVFKAHELIDLNRMPYCRWERDYTRLKRVYNREYNPANWKAIGWYCPNCNNFINGF